MTHKTPKGWKRLRNGTRIKQGDKFLDYHGRWMASCFFTITGTLGFVGGPTMGSAQPLIYIRRIKRKKK